MSIEMFPNKLTNMFVQNKISFELIIHEPEGRTDLASKIRGNKLNEAAKAMVLMAKFQNGCQKYYLAVVPGDCRIDFEAVKRFSKGSKVRLAPADKASELTGCVMGAVPPFSFNANLVVLVDPYLLANDRFVFNAGRLDQSIFISSKDYLSVANPTIYKIAKR